ncbi:DUF4123 domain-containing protein [Enterovibrio baiacu]|uniref:DUF4123 domain-containing protein n=1 Tax=Enterovibrio baiacu TaxID=2491023 RepID=UPI00101373AD|nr:DUF4123 domain-containing protein [Enterovibrio baiacu]MBE1277789.1 DUF4123 domain-containing protein [Enterovibrio baiacu]
MSVSKWKLVDIPHEQDTLTWATQGDYHWLYTNTPLNVSMEASPLLIDVSEPREGAMPEQIVHAPTFQTRASSDVFIAHLRSLVIMRSPADKPVTVRFYVPTYLTFWLSKLPIPRQETLMGCIEHIQWQGHQLSLPDDAQSVKRFEVNTTLGWFALDEQEWALLKDAYQNRNSHPEQSRPQATT